MNLKTQEQLKKAWDVLENNMEEHGRLLFRSLFKADPDLMPHYPFYKDEWNKISYADYAGTLPDQPINTWFVVFRYGLFSHGYLQRKLQGQFTLSKYSSPDNLTLAHPG